MMRFLKRPLRAIWVWTYPLEPSSHEEDRAVHRAVGSPAPACRVSEETGLLMDLMVRELVRLQKQLDQLQQAVEDLAAANRPGCRRRRIRVRRTRVERKGRLNRHGDDRRPDRPGVQVASKTSQIR